jgi:hypothetical protein
MELEEAKEVLKIEKGVADLDISNNQHNQNTINFSEAVKVVLSELDKLSQRQKLIEKLDEDILEDGYMREEPYFLGRVEEAQSIKDFIGG